MTRARIPVAGPWVTDLEVAYTADAARNAWYEHSGEYPLRFEEAFASFLGRHRAISLPSATSGIHLALAAAGIGPGDEVVVPALTWIATSAPVHYLGAEPVLVDVEPATWCISPSSFADAITDRTAAVIAVDLYGGVPEWREVEAIAAAHDLFVLEDAAEAVGSRYRGQLAGSFGDASVFSFHGSKTLTTGEGGLVAMDSPDLAERVALLRDHGRLPDDRFFNNTEVAYKYKMSALQAAFGLAQLERVGELVEKKRKIFSWYYERLHADERFMLNAEPPGTTNSYWMVTIVLASSLAIDVRALMATFGHHGIDTRPMFRPLHLIPAYAGSRVAERAAARVPVATSLDGRGLNLPSALSIEESDVDRVVEVLLRAVEEAG